MAQIKSRYLGTGAAGLALLAFALTYTSGWEGRRLVAYRDVGGVWTICDGVTKGVYPGMRVTAAQCDDMERAALIEHEEGLLACSPEMLAIPAKSYVAINDWAYNVGVGAACKSGLIARIKAGDLRGACEQLGRWVYVRGRVYQGLVNRRIRGTAGRVSERDLCLQGVAEGSPK